MQGNRIVAQLDIQLSQLQDHHHQKRSFWSWFRLLLSWLSSQKKKRKEEAEGPIEKEDIIIRNFSFFSLKFGEGMSATKKGNLEEIESSGEGPATIIKGKPYASWKACYDRAKNRYLDIFVTLLERVKNVLRTRFLEKCTML